MEIPAEDPSMPEPDAPVLRALRENMQLHRVPIIVIGAGVSAGANVPTLTDIHKYLAKQLGALSSETAKAASHLINALQSDPNVSPRSVSVRLYHLLQTATDAEVRKLWAQFGKDLVAGKVTSPGQALAKISPTAAHLWAAHLALLDRAIIVSLNYDGLTRLAAAQAARILCLPREPRLLSDEAGIRGFFTGEESKGSGITPLPIIKFRGDVFHAVCVNGRCPSHGKLQALYDLLPKDGSKAPSDNASELLLCSECRQDRVLQISFPGIAAKEREITQAIGAVHEFCGNSIAGIIFLGFSGRWDESLTRYLIGRAKALKAPIVSVGVDETRFIEMEATAVGARDLYLFQPANFTEKRSVEFLRNIVSVDEKIKEYEAASGAATVSFPHGAFRVWRADSVTIQLPGDAGSVRNLTVNSSPGSDDFTGVAAAALTSKDLKRLERCSQLGPKGIFLREKTPQYHNRLEHSAEAALIAMIWFEALAPQANRGGARNWAASSDARLALEMTVLFHDARHLPFSHMMEEVFRELNWAEVPALECPNFPAFTEAIKDTSGGQTALKDWWAKVEAIQQSRSGVPWLEAIADSALDADKIAYVFNDSSLTGQGVRLAGIRPWIEEFVGGQSLTAEGLIRLEGGACEASLALLQERMHLYQSIYLTPELRSLEAVARYIVTTWLEWKVPERLGFLLTDKATAKTTRELKTEKARELLWEKFETSAHVNEVTVLQSMIEELDATGAVDKSAMDWLKECWNRLKDFARSLETGEEPSMVKARAAYRSIAPVGPVYFHERHLEAARRIARQWRVHFPCSAIVDMVKFPRFLATPDERSWQTGSRELIVAEQFLVPSENPSQWHRAGRATVPLHRCDFSAFNQPVVQVLVVDPLGNASSASHFLFDMMGRDLRAAGISLVESPQQAKAAGMQS